MAHADAALHQLKAVMEKESLQKLQSVQAAVQRKEAELQVCLMQILLLTHELLEQVNTCILHTKLLCNTPVWLLLSPWCNRSVCACTNHHLKALLEALIFAQSFGTALSALCCTGQMSCIADCQTATCVFGMSQNSMFAVHPLCRTWQVGSLS